MRRCQRGRRGCSPRRYGLLVASLELREPMTEVTTVPAMPSAPTPPEIKAAAIAASTTAG